MKKRFAAIATSVLLTIGGASAVSMVVGSPAGATTTATTTHHHRLRAHVLRFFVKETAPVVKMSPKQLVSELRSGKSVASIARTEGISPTTVVNDLVQAANQKISALQQEGKINADQASKLRSHVPTWAAKFVNWVPKRQSSSAS